MRAGWVKGNTDSLTLTVVIHRHFTQSGSRNRIVGRNGCSLRVQAKLVKGKQTASRRRERSFIERYIRRDEFETLFGGEMLLADPSGGSEFIGVWGRKR